MSVTQSTSTIPTESGPPSVLWKAFDVLSAFNQRNQVLTLSEIARRSGLPKSTTHRILTMLHEVQAVERVGDVYKVGIRMFTMGAMSLDAKVRDLARPELERLRRVTRQTVHLAVLQGSDVIYLDKLLSLVSPQTPALVGGRMPAHRTGVGKALLAFSDQSSSVDPSVPLHLEETTVTLGHYLEETRRTGVATDRGEATRGLSCVAVPILVDGKALAAVSVAYASGDGTGQQFINPLRESAAALARTLRHVEGLTT